MSTSNPFDVTKKYDNIELQDGQFVVAGDFNHVQSIVTSQQEETGKFLAGYALSINHMVNSPVFKVRANNSLTEGQVITIEFTAATTVRWRKNSDAWSAGIAVVKDNVTWNTIGTSGLDIVFVSTATTGDISEIWVAQGMRLLGGEMADTGVGSQLKLNSGSWMILGKYVSLGDLVVSTVSDEDYLYIRVTESRVTHVSDPEIGHRLADGNYASVSPIAIQKVYELMSSAAFPNNTTTPYAEYIIVGKASVATGVVTPTYMWPNPYDLQKIIREKGDTDAPSVPTGLALTTGAEESLVLSTSGVMLSPMPNGWITASCNSTNEPDTMMYEFKFCTINAMGVVLNSFTVPVYPNTDIGGGGGVPIGISHTLHNQRVGVKYRVYVRAYDFSGNVSAWSTQVDETVGGTCDIAAGAAGPVFTMTDGNTTVGYPGFIITITSLPVGGAGWGIWAAEGAYPNIASNEGFLGYHLSSVTSIRVPWDEKGYPHVRLKAFDAAGLLQTLYSESSLELAQSTQISVNNHNTNAGAHGGVISDVAMCQEPYGTLYKWIRILENQKFAIANTYWVSTKGTQYTTIQAALDQIAVDLPDYARIYVIESADTSTIIIPDLHISSTYGTRLEIIGLGNAIISYDIDVSNAFTLPSPIGHYGSERYYSLLIRNLGLGSRIYGTMPVGEAGGLLLDNMDMMKSTADGLVDLDGAGAWLVKIINSLIVNEGVGPAINLYGNIHARIEDNTLITTTGGPGIYFDTAGALRRMVKNNSIQTTAGAAGAIHADAGGPYTVVCFNNAWNVAPSAEITVEDGSVTTNTLMPAAFVTG